MRRRSVLLFGLCFSAVCLLVAGYLLHGSLSEWLLLPLRAQTVSGIDVISPASSVQIDDVFWDPRFGTSGPNGRVLAIAIDGDDVYIGGQFGVVGGVWTQGVARWDGHDWQSVGGGVDGWVHAMAVLDGQLYVAGAFTHAGGVSCNYIARWDGSAWHALGSGVTDLHVNPPIVSMAVYRGELYVGGGFGEIGGTTAHSVARWDPSGWHALDVGVDFGEDAGVVYGMDADSSYLYLGGRFLTAGGEPYPYLVRWNGTEFSSVGETGFLGDINSIAVVEGNLYVAGVYRIFPGDSMTVENLGMWDGAAWHDLNGGTNYEVQALGRLGSDIYAVGLFTRIGEIYARRVAKWNGSVWSKFGSGLQFDGVAGTVWAVAARGGEELFVGGDFNVAGWKSSPYFARWYVSQPPNIVVYPDSIEDVLHTGAVSVHDVVIKNIGGMVLEWSAILPDSLNGPLIADGISVGEVVHRGVSSGEDSSAVPVPEQRPIDLPWASALPPSGEIFPGDSAVVEVTFNAGGLSGGEYRTLLTVRCNHPDEPEISVPLRLAVIAAADIVLSDTLLEFGIVTVNTTARDTVDVANSGPDTLHVLSIQTDNPRFIVDGSPFAVPPGGIVPVEVDFTPVDESSSSGTLTITSDDPDEAVVTVSLTGAGRLPIYISVEPDSLYESLYADEVSTQTLLIDNIGAGSFAYIARIRRRDIVDSAAVARAPASLDSMYLAGLKVLFDRAHGQELMSSRSIFITALSGLGATVDENTSSITQAILDGYDIFWTTEMATDFTQDEITALVNWVGAGGGMLLIGDDDYSLYNYDALSMSLGAGLNFDAKNAEPGVTNNIYSHPATQNVHEIYLIAPYASFISVVTPASRLVDDERHTPVVAASHYGAGRLVGATEEIFNNHAVSFYDNQLFGVQVMHWLIAGVDWLSLAPASGSIPSQESAGLEVRFDAKGLAFGDYDAEILLVSTSWDSAMAIVPVHMSVVPVPEIWVSTSSLEFETLYVGVRDSLSVSIANLGTSTLSIDTVAIDSPWFSVDTTAFSLEPGAAIARAVTFRPLEAGLFTGTLRIVSNDPDERVVTIALEGTAVEPPLIAVTVDSLMEQLLPGESSLRPLVIENRGGDDLQYWLGVYSSSPGTSDRFTAGDRAGGKSRQADGGTPSALMDLAVTASAHESAESAGIPRCVEEPGVHSLFDSSMVFFDNFEDRNYDGWSEGSSTGVREVTDATAANGSWYSYHEYHSSPGHFNGIYQVFGAVQPANVSFWVRSGSAVKNDAYVVFRGSLGQEVIWFFASSAGTFYLNADTGGNQAYAYLPRVWYHIEFVNIDFVDKTFDYLVNDSLIQVAIPFRNGQLIHDIYRLDLYNYSWEGEAWWDEIFMGLDVPVNWLRVDRRSGTVAPYSAATVTVSIDASELKQGSYRTHLQILSNSTINQLISLPVHLDVDSSLQRAVALPLEAGWNLVSWNVEPPVDSVAALLAPVMKHLVVAHAFDRAGLTYAPGLPPRYNTLQRVPYTKGVWLRLSEQDTLAINGAAVHSQLPDILRAGYNLVSYLPYQEDSVGHAFASILPSLELAIGYNGQLPLLYDAFAPPGTNTLVRVEPGAGYWLKLTAPDTLSYPGLPVYPSQPPFMTAAACAGGGAAVVIPTTEWVNVWGDSVDFINGPIASGTVVQAIDRDSVVCGEFVVTTAGSFGIMPVYRDDPFTSEDEGAEPGDTVMIFFDSLPSYRSFVWSENGEIIRYEDFLTAAPEQPADLPALLLHQNYPNPFNPSTTIRFELPEAMAVRLAVYTVEGKLVRVLADGSRPAGIGRATWDGRDGTGNPAASGIYFYRLDAGGRVLTRKMVLLK